ncbi:MAG: PAS domain S-box protein [Bacteroidales bacterium]|nr:PAS domain S-box protein [Bacteroidales bacterium]
MPIMKVNMENDVKKSILLVEDEAILAMTEKMSLEKYGYSVITVTTGEEAVEAVKSTPGIDLILMDINLGKGIDGTEAAELILKDHDNPIIFVSSHTEKEIVEKTEKITSYGYVVKSSSITVLDASIKMAFKLFEAEKGVKNNERRFHELFQNMRSAVAVYNAVDNGNDFIFIDFNKAAEQIDKISKENIVGKKVTEVFPGVEEVELFIVFKRVWKTGISEHCPMFQYKDDRIEGWRDNFVYKLPSGELVAIYDDITKHKQAEATIKESEAKLKSYIENAPDGVFIADEKGKYLEVNKAACKITGYSEDELLNLTIPELIQEEYLEKAGNHFQSVAIDGYAGAKLGFVTKSGEKRFWNIDAVKLSETRFLGFAKDITERRQGEEKLKESEERFRLLTENTLDTIWSTDLNFNIQFVNNSIIQFLGYTPAEFLGSNLSLFTPKEGLKALQEAAENLISEYKQGKIIQQKFEIKQIRARHTNLK